MTGIVLTDDILKLLEKRFGPCVRRMGEWNSDGTFGYSWISMADVAKAVDSIGDSRLETALSKLNEEPDQTVRFVALLETFGGSFIERISAVYRYGSVEVTSGDSTVKKAPEQESRMQAAAAG